jgi:hypothetical protein
MGVSDYTCSVCGAPQSYSCGEAKGEDCDVTGFGNDEVFLELLFFDEADAPTGPDEVLSARGRAKKAQVKKWGYDWGEWEFVPSLNYRELLMGDGDPRGIWRVVPFDPATSDGHEVEVTIPAGQTLWVVNFCPDCHAVFVKGKPPKGGPCRLHLEAIAEHLDVALDLDDKAGAVATVADLLAPAGPTKAKAPKPKPKPKTPPAKAGLSQPLFSEALKKTLQPKKGASLAGQTFVLTGTLAKRTREEATAAIEAAGGQVKDTVSKQTTFLVCGADPGSKLEKATSLGVSIIDEKKLEKLLGG